MSTETMSTEFDPFTNEAWNNPALSAPEKILSRWQSVKFIDSDNRGQNEKFLTAALSGKLSFDDFDRELLRAQLRDSELHGIRASRPAAPAMRGTSGSSDQDAVLRAACCMHLSGDNTAARLYGDQVTSEAKRLGCRSIMAIIEAGCRMNGINAVGPNELLKAGFSTVNLPGILSDSANKLLMDAYKLFPSVARLTSKTLSARDFKTCTGYRLDDQSVMEELGDGGEIKHGSLSESSFTFKLATFAKMYNLTRQAIVNDDVGSFAQVPNTLARGAGMALESAWATLLLSNPASFFVGGHGNYLSSGSSVLSRTSLGAALTALRAQTDASGLPIMVQPKFLLVPPELEITARELMQSTTTAVTGTTDARMPSGNAFFGLAEVIVSPFLSNASFVGATATQWYLLAAPTDLAITGVAFLDGMESPTIESSQSDFDTLGMQFRGYHDFGVCMVDYRAGVKSAGA